MEDIKIQVAKIVGTPTPTSWAQTLVQENLFIVLEVSGKDGEGGENVASVGKRLLAEVSSELRGREKKNLVALKESVAKSVEGVPPNLHVNVAALLLTQPVAYLVIRGGGRVWLQRGGVLAPVLRAEEESEITSGSGFLKACDLLLLTTPQFEALVPKAELEESLEGLTPSEIAETLSPIVHGSEEGSGVASIIIAYDASKRITPPVLGKVRNVWRAFPWEVVRRNSFLIAIIFILVLLGSIVFGVRRREVFHKNTQFRKVMKEAEAKFEQGVKLLDVNRSLAYEAFLSSKKILEEGKGGIEADSKEGRALNTLLFKVDEFLLRSGRIYRIDRPELFFDVALIKDGAVGSKFSLLGKELSILDRKNRSVYTLALGQKSSEIKAANFSSPSLIASDSENIYVLDDEGIHRVEKRSKKKTLVFKRGDPSADATSDVADGFEAVASFSTFLSNLYLLDSEHSKIVKFVPTANSYVRRSYLAPDIRPNLAKAVSLTIDGAIYILFSDGKILKYLQGAPVDFRITGLDVSFSAPSTIFTSAELEHVYVLDTGGGRVVVLDKTGSYKEQYLWEGIKDVADMVISESERKILLLSESKIYEIALR